MLRLYIWYDNYNLTISLEMFTTSDITKAICRSCDKNEKLRLQALLLVKNGSSPDKVAKDFSVNRSTVYRWMKRAEEEGLLSLKCKPGRGVKVSSLIYAENLDFQFNVLFSLIS